MRDQIHCTGVQSRYSITFGPNLPRESYSRRGWHRERTFQHTKCTCLWHRFPYCNCENYFAQFDSHWFRFLLQICSRRSFPANKMITNVTAIYRVEQTGTATSVLNRLSHQLWAVFFTQTIFLFLNIHIHSTHAHTRARNMRPINRLWNQFNTHSDNNAVWADWRTTNCNVKPRWRRHRRRRLLWYKLHALLLSATSYELNEWKNHTFFTLIGLNRDLCACLCVSSCASLSEWISSVYSTAMPFKLRQLIVYWDSELALAPILFTSNTWYSKRKLNR